MTEPACLPTVPKGLCPLQDVHGRCVSYLRLSVTDRCNLNCRYCRVDSTFIPHERVLRYEEMEALVDIAVELGVRKLRLTGGEPFVRKGFVDFLHRIRAKHANLDLRITSNGTLIGAYAEVLKSLGAAVNVSLDSFDAAKFAAITGRDLLGKVRDGIDALLAAGVPVKINAVALAGKNDNELPAFLEFARQHPVDVRFIEFMPMGEATAWNQHLYWPAEDILAAAQEICTLTPVARHAETDGPARMYQVDGGLGRFGLITPLSNHFCASCNRLRVTSDGKLRTCLFDDREYKLAPALRHPKLGVNAVRKIIQQATKHKPIGSVLLEKRGKNAVAMRTMTAIGG